MAKASADRSLRRLGGGRWQTPDGRFTIEPQSGTWALVDGEQTDELGLPLVRGPYRSLSAAKAAIDEVETAEPPVSPLADRIAEVKRRPPKPARAAAPAKAAALPKPPPPPEIPDGISVETIYIIEAEYGPHADRKRPAVRPRHLAHVAELMKTGVVIEAGGYLDLSSAVLLVRAASEKEALAVVRNDVYVTSGVWTGAFRIRPFGRVVVDRSG